LFKTELNNNTSSAAGGLHIIVKGKLLKDYKRRQGEYSFAN